jgi:hypothetical protein
MRQSGLSTPHKSSHLQKVWRTSPILVPKGQVDGNSVVDPSITRPTNSIAEESNLLLPGNDAGAGTDLASDDPTLALFNSSLLKN